MKRLFTKVKKSIASAPGTIEYTGETGQGPVRIDVVEYSQDVYAEKQIANLKDYTGPDSKNAVVWINVTGVHDVRAIEEAGERFGIHPLVLENIAHVDQRPKAEDYDQYLYFVLKMLRRDQDKSEILSEQVSVVMGRNYVISFQEKPGDVFDSVRQRIKNTRWRHRGLGPDYLAYALIDAIVDHYFVVLEHFGEAMEVFEEEIGDRPGKETLQKIHQLKREMIYLKKAVWPLRELIGNFSRSDSKLVQKSTGPYLKDLYDHTIQVVEMTESLKDALTGIQDLYHTSISTRMNEVMKVLTIIATVFIPPTFIAGVYGMNFENMPELHAHFGYFVVLGVMSACIAGMILYFKKQNWF